MQAPFGKPDGATCGLRPSRARALQSIRDSAETLADYAGTEAQAMGCGFEDPAEMRRAEAAEAAEAAARAMAQLFERRPVPRAGRQQRLMLRRL
ncbi:hypothetical protein [Delftia tsuruhatensis]|uniref:hypothetical protein n=1 Tax=Delftia tsuruhatensis TaxID=180282 RepID=UPI0035E3D0A0